MVWVRKSDDTLSYKSKKKKRSARKSKSHFSMKKGPGKEPCLYRKKKFVNH